MSQGIDRVASSQDGIDSSSLCRDKAEAFNSGLAYGSYNAWSLVMVPTLQRTRVERLLRRQAIIPQSSEGANKTQWCHDSMLLRHSGLDVEKLP